MKKDLKVNFTLKDVPKLILKNAKVLSRYATISFIVIIVGLYGFLVMSISTGSQAEPTEEQIQEQLGTVKRLKVDQTSIDKIEQLEDQNVIVKSLFKDARENPFKE